MNQRLTFFISLSLVAATSICGVSAQQTEPRVALVIGNAAYPDAEAPLKDPVNHARALAEELRRDGFEVDVGENLTKQATRSAIDRFYGKIKPGSAALIFFSGYGIQSDRQTYMVPINAQIWTETDVRRDGFSLDSILAEMNSAGAKVKIAILDASRRNPFERRFRSVAAGLAPAAAPKGTVVMYAAGPGSVLRDSERQFFVSELLKEISRPGKIEEVFNRTLAAVSRESRGEQAPWFSSSLVDEFSFVQPARLSPNPEPEKRPQVSPPDPEAEARREYQSAERLGTMKGWQDFIRKYPSGRYSDLAREQLARLETPPVRPAPPTVTPRVKPDARLEDPAIRDLDKRIELKADDAAAYYKRGQLYAQHGDFPRAIKDFDAAIRLNPKDAEAFNNRCWARAIVGELQPALKDCNDALQLRPRYLDALDSRGFVNLKMGRPRDALADYEAALRINSKHPSSLYGRGIAKLRTGNTADGNGDIAAAKAVQPDIAEEFATYGIPESRAESR
jgi:tetratricopeptide (TPR) repeat protein